ncbi:hypothetical protein [Evansella tamaricis]
MQNQNERLITILREHPDREPTTDMKDRLKARLREQAQMNQRKDSLFLTAKIATTALVSAFILFLLFTSSGLDTVKNMLPGGTSSETAPGTPVIPEDEAKDDDDGMEEETTTEKIPAKPFVEGESLINVQNDLELHHVDEKAIRSFLHYLMAAKNGDLDDIQTFGFLADDMDESIAIRDFYEQTVEFESLQILEVQFSRAEPDIFVQLAYGDKLEQKTRAASYIITFTGTDFEVYDTIPSQHEAGAFPLTEKIKEVYESFAENHSPEALLGLEPVEFVTLYYYTEQLRDYETLYELHLQEEKYLPYESKEHFIEEMTSQSDGTTNLSDTIEDELITMYRFFLWENKSDIGVKMIFKNQEHPLIFHVDMEDGVYKSHWLPLQ